jgi:hypothetical protein
MSYHDELRTLHGDLPDSLMHRREGEMLDKACAEVDRLRATIAALETRVKEGDAIAAAYKRDADAFHWIMAHCTEAVEIYEEHVEGYNAPLPARQPAPSEGEGGK